jgi:hypothetical protein
MNRDRGGIGTEMKKHSEMGSLEDIKPQNQDTEDSDMEDEAAAGRR